MSRTKALGETILTVDHLTKHYPIKKGLFGRAENVVHAVEDVSFQVRRGETFAIVGESGCGKSTTGKCVLRLTEPTEGTVTLDGVDFTALSGDALTEARKRMTLIFQDPYSSLNPRMTVADIIAEPLDIAHTYATKAERDGRVEEIMEKVGLDLTYKYRYPHEFSGGQRQRIGVARAIVQDPEIVICDEPVSALDVSVQAKVINLLEQLQDELGLAYVFISHDLSVVKHISDTIMVMYLGHMMEQASAPELFAHPSHPYTQALLDVVPRITKGRIADKRVLTGDVPSPANPPSGCCFHTRCERCMRVCSQRVPKVCEIAPGHSCACHLFDYSLSSAEREPQRSAQSL